MNEKFKVSIFVCNSNALKFPLNLQLNSWNLKSLQIQSINVSETWSHKSRKWMPELAQDFNFVSLYSIFSLSPICDHIVTQHEQTTSVQQNGRYSEINSRKQWQPFFVLFSSILIRLCATQHKTKQISLQLEEASSSERIGHHGNVLENTKMLFSAQIATIIVRDIALSLLSPILVARNACKTKPDEGNFHSFHVWLSHNFSYDKI